MRTILKLLMITEKYWTRLLLIVTISWEKLSLTDLESVGTTKNLANFKALILLISFEILKFIRAVCGVFIYGIVSLMINNKLVTHPNVVNQGIYLVYLTVFLSWVRARCGVFTYGTVSLMTNKTLVHPPKSS